MIIRNGREADIPAIAAIEAECIAEPWSENALRSAFSRGELFLVAEDENRVVFGFIAASSVLDEVCVDNIAVLPRYRKKGTADALLNALYGSVGSFAAFITLEVREGNSPAIGLYRKHGFEQVGMRKNYYRNPAESAVLYTKFFPLKGRT